MKITLAKQDWQDIVEDALSWMVVLAMLIYGGAKYFQFGNANEVEKMVSEMTGMELMWAFYAYSKTFAVLIGVLEIIGGLLIFFRKTRIIGCLFTSTILVNIILQDIIYEVNQGALMAAVIYQSCIAIILWMRRYQLWEGIQKLLAYKGLSETWTKRLVKWGIAFIIFVLLRALEFLFTTGRL